MKTKGRKESPIEIPIPWINRIFLGYTTIDVEKKGRKEQIVEWTRVRNLNRLGF